MFVRSFNLERVESAGLEPNIDNQILIHYHIKVFNTDPWLGRVGSLAYLGWVNRTQQGGGGELGLIQFNF
jgi:hypothetical protein